MYLLDLHTVCSMIKDLDMLVHPGPPLILFEGADGLQVELVLREYALDLALDLNRRVPPDERHPDVPQLGLIDATFQPLSHLRRE